MSIKHKGIILAVILIPGIIGAILLSHNQDRPASRVAVGIESPAFELKDTDGRLWKLADLRGKVVLLNLWASWCETCKEEMPSIQRLINANKDNGKLIFISVLYNDDPEKALSYLKANGFAFTVLVDNGNIARLYGITGVPETFVIDKKGIIRQKVVGPLQWDSPEVTAALTRMENE
jgi:cytochrome c biogenesis protein CcmG/thiol:disulfide interchange protein DsbE